MTCHCGNIVENHDTGLCASCNKAVRDADRKKSKPVKERKPIAKTSDKMAEALKEYAKLRKEFLAANPRCAVYPDQPSIEVHHMAGRNTIELLLDTDKWLAVSRQGHRDIEMNPEWAKEQGYSLTRLGKLPDYSIANEPHIL